MVGTVKEVHITPEVLEQMYDDDFMCSSIRWAHTKVSGMERERIALCKGGRYIVTDEQIEQARIQYEKRRIEIMEEHKNNLLFVGMGTTYEPLYKGDPGNHRIRTEFINSKGNRHFIEISKWGDRGVRVNHSVDRDMEARYEAKLVDAIKRRNVYNPYSREWKEIHQNEVERWMQQDYYNFANLERSSPCRFEAKSILRMVNRHFDCNFKAMHVAHRMVSIDKEPICFSPKR